MKTALMLAVLQQRVNALLLQGDEERLESAVMDMTAVSSAMEALTNRGELPLPADAHRAGIP